MLRIAFGILLGTTLMAAAQSLIVNLPTEKYLLCVPPWPVTDSFGVIHPYPAVEK